MINFLYIFLALLISIILHEAGHMISALLCGVKVNAFSIGFGKPYLHKKIWGIDFRLTPFLLGGYTALAGEYDKYNRGFLAQPYRKKVIILLSGVLTNFLIAFVCYLINYGSIKIGLNIDFALMKSVFTKNFTEIFLLLEMFKPNLFLLQLSLISFFCGIFNLIPFPSLDGGFLWLVFLEKKIN